MLILSLIATLPIWIANYPPMTDLPQHAAQVALLGDLHDPRFGYGALYTVNWFTPYLLGYLLIYIVTPVVGAVAACKLVVSIFIVGFPLASALLLDALEIDPFWAILCIPGTYGFAYQWGFLNFLVAAPLGILFFWLVVRSPARANWRTAALFAASAVGLFFCHALVCAFFGLCAATWLLVEARSLRAAMMRALPLAAVLPVAALWMKTVLGHPAARRPIIWDLDWWNTVEPYYTSLSEELHLAGASWGRLNGFFPRLFGVAPSWHYVLPGVLLFLLPFFGGMCFGKRPGAWMSFFICVGVLLSCPHAAVGTEFVYQRFTMFAVPFFLLLLRPTPISRKKALAARSVAVVLVVGFVYLASMRAVVFSRQAQGFQQALTYMEPGQRVLSLAFDHADGVSIAPVFLHFPQWYAAQKRGVVDPSAAMMHPELVVYRAGETPKAVLWDFEWNPEEFNWNEYSREQYRYFVVRSADNRGAALFAQAPCPIALRFHQDEWWLYERPSNCNVALTQRVISASQ
ncbi:hypothetical protein ACPOL_5320 [Acidisarcina polymorpha]|uniref:Membrane protein 6-pyruvoyl-tetrahydropterin synthase-related domain-containing protein n=1 Tax=Acidisarcina polymorpha TaxID=2211140 RepID=A0A2Z5G6G8_9BACT|nr:hypothetical protein ACPOL_5320 [Acidisarcina polymorpha]